MLLQFIILYNFYIHAEIPQSLYHNEKNAVRHVPSQLLPSAPGGFLKLTKLEEAALVENMKCPGLRGSAILAGQQQKL